MNSRLTLAQYIEHYSEAGPRCLSVAAAIDAIATAAIDIADLICRGALAGITGRTQGTNTDGDVSGSRRRRDAATKQHPSPYASAKH